ncbi:MAG TPA: integrin alpha, partial [Candidatus Krumholzibacteria bacterium]|nr:integrin alpha [Candidatus Krumholzibacteria bacterium]
AELHHGDINGDGCADILISSGPDDYDTTDVGKVTIVYGSTVPPDTVLLGTDPGLTRIYAETRPDAFGRGLLSYDINRDGVDDVIVGAYRAEAAGRTAAGKAYGLFGARDAAVAVERPRSAVRLGQNYPNPFNPITFVPVSLARPEELTLLIHDVRGGRIRTLLDQRLEAGEHRDPVGWTRRPRPARSQRRVFLPVVGRDFRRNA